MGVKINKEWDRESGGTTHIANEAVTHCVFPERIAQSALPDRVFSPTINPSLLRKSQGEVTTAPDVNKLQCCSTRTEI